MKLLFSFAALLLCLSVLAPAGLSAQDYKSAAGVRLGYPLAASYKTFLNESNAVEAYVGYRGFGSVNWITLNAAYLVHKDLDVSDDINGLRWYFGGGAGVQFWNSDFFDDGTTTFSVSGYLGLEYTFDDTPVAVSLDYVPTFFIGDGFGGFSGFGAGYGALGVRYVLNRGGE